MLEDLKRARCVLLLLATTCLAGCSTLAGSYSSSTPSRSSTKAGISGIPYSLPKALVRVGLIRDMNGIAIIIDQPKFIPDPSASYLLSYRPSGTSIDKLKVTVEDDLLTAINGEADDQSAAIVEAIGKLLLGRPESAIEKIDQSAGEILFDYTFDPADQDEWRRVERWLNEVLAKSILPSLTRECENAVAQALEGERDVDGETSATRVRKLTEQATVRTPVCRAAATYHAPVISLAFAYKPFRFDKSVAVEPCTVGICARKLSPALLAFQVNGVPFASEQFLLPNGSDAVPYSLMRTTFTKTTHTLIFTNGSISSAEVEKGSEFLAVAETPFKIIKGAFAAVSELVQLRINLTNKDKELVEARTQLREAEEQLEAAHDLAQDKGKAEAGLSAAKAMMFAYVPGLGPGSGLGTTLLPSSTQNEAERTRNAADGQQGARGIGQPQAPAGQQQPKPKPDAAVGVDAGDVLGTLIQGGSDGKEPK
ncbi:MAG TPA: hypothetical protein VIG90_15115 [Pedomonas sp.]|uniref:hypothetical protein n=1 Tax=Pedomonas sp. TaxID=2976421 RepID=UPI002F4213C7